MKQKIISLIATLFSIAYVGAVPALQKPFTVTQPDGSILALHMVGDEYYHWIETADNQVVVLSEEGYYEYAIIKDNDIIASGVKVSENKQQNEIILDKKSLLSLMMDKREHVMMHMDSLSWEKDTKDSATISPTKTTSTKSMTDGNAKVLCILIGFPDKPFTKSASDFENMWNQTNYNVAGSYGSIKEYYLENSYGDFNVTATVVGPYTAKHNSSYYATGSDIANSNVRELVREALTAAKSDIRFNNFDLDGDKFVDAVHIVFAGYGCEVSTSTGLIWSHQWSLSTAVLQGLYKAKKYFITPELADGSGTMIAPMGTVCHEYGHQLGAPDFYSNAGLTGTGTWDVMGSGSWNGPFLNPGRCPAHHNPYTKAYIYNWVTPYTIYSSQSNTTYSVTPSHNTKSIYRINTSTNNEFYLIENKRTISNTFNACVPGEGGLLIYHIHSDIVNAITDNNVNHSHPQKCYIVCANATSNPTSSASSYGTMGIECAYPYINNMFFTSKLIPSSKSWAGINTGVDLCFIQRNGNNIKFVVNPQIIGESTLTTQSTYSVINVPPSAKIKWTYIYSSSWVFLYEPIIFVNGDSTSSVVIQRGQYPIYNDSIHIENPWDHPSIPNNPIIGLETSITSQSYKYYTGTAILKATITSGNYSYVLTKIITLTNPSTISNAPESEYINDTDMALENIEELEYTNSSLSSYRLRYENPIYLNGSVIHIEIAETSNNYMPYTGNYTLELWSNYGLIRQISNQSADVYFDYSNLPSGVYQLVLKIDNQVVTNGKILII